LRLVSQEVDIQILSVEPLHSSLIPAEQTQNVTVFAELLLEVIDEGLD
jgi:hypothetical protein